MGKAWKYKPNTKAITGAREGSARGLSLAAEHILGVAKAQTPIEEGNLRRSGFTSVSGKSYLRAAVSFDTPYAIPVHENMHARHPEGNAKFLENAFNSEVEKAREIIAQEIRGEL